MFGNLLLMKQHLGQILEKAIRQSNYPISKLAKKIGYTRQHMYNLFSQQQVDLELLEEIGKVIRFDFSQHIKALKKYKLDSTINESFPNINDSHFQEKYFMLLEDYNALLKEHNSIIKEKFFDYLKKHKL